MSHSRLVLCLAAALSLPLSATAVLTSPSVARADEVAAMKARPTSFALFGRSVCFSHRGRCDVSLADPGVAPLATPPRHVKRWKVLGVSLCGHQEVDGPACDVSWSPPEAVMPWPDAWQDFPETRLNSDMRR